LTLRPVSYAYRRGKKCAKIGESSRRGLLAGRLIWLYASSLDRVVRDAGEGGRKKRRKISKWKKGGQDLSGTGPSPRSGPIDSHFKKAIGGGITDGGKRRKGVRKGEEMQMSNAVRRRYIDWAHAPALPWNGRRRSMCGRLLWQR